MITGTTFQHGVTPYYNYWSAKTNQSCENGSRGQFLYIGSHPERLAHWFSFSDHRLISHNFSEAMNALIRLYEDGLTPDFIVVDLPFDENSTSQFVLWLHSHKWSYRIPVLYNAALMSTREIAQLKELNIADHIITTSHP